MEKFELPTQFENTENEPKREETSVSPEGWKTNEVVSRELGIDKEKVKKVADTYYQSNPEYFGKFKNHRGRTFKHYSPELINIIKEKIEKFKITTEAPEGWKNNYTLAKELDIDRTTIKNIADKYIESHPEYYKDYKAKGGPIREYYSPDLVDLILRETKELRETLEAPAGWKNLSNIAIELGGDFRMIENISSQFRESHPEYFKKFKIKEGQIHEHYSPELFEIIKNQVQKFKEIPPVPEGWKTCGTLSSQSGIAYVTIDKITDPYRKTNPEYFKEFKIEKGQVREHYSPELVSIITKEIEKYSQVPEGWMAKRTLAKDLGVAEKTVSDIVNKYKATNSEYTGFYKPPRGAIGEYYSPEFIQIITEYINKTPKAPEGWMAKTSLAADLNIHKKAIEKLVDRYRESNPEYFKEFKSKMGKVIEYYAPDLVDIISKEVFERNKEVPAVPENWQSIQDIAERLGISKEEVEKMAKKLRQEHHGEFGKFKDRDES